MAGKGAVMIRTLDGVTARRKKPEPLAEQVRRRPAIRPRTEVRLHTEMNLRVIEGDEAVSAAVPGAGTETKPAVIGKGSGQVTNREDRRYSRTHDCNLSRPARAVQASARPARP
jgi:hypothetical protein